MIRKTLCLMLLLAGATLAGCGQSSSPPRTKVETATAPDGKKYLLDAEPTGAKSVLDTRKDAKDGEDVVMVGRIAGSEKPFVDGRASFSVTDLKIQPCADEEGCPTPWDCCCTPKEVLLPAMAQVKFVDTAGKTLSVSARDLLGVKELTVVVVRGKANRDEQGNLTVVASDLYPRKGK